MTKGERNRRNKAIKAYYGQNTFEECFNSWTMSYDQEELNELFEAIPNINSLGCIEYNCFTDTPSVQRLKKAEVVYMYCVSPTKENEEMNTVTPDFTAQRRSLENVMYNAKDAHCRTLADKYHTNPQRPKTVQEGIDWIKEGKYSIKMDGYTASEIKIEPYETFTQYIKWTAEKADQKGFDAHYDKMCKEHDDIMLRVRIKEPTEVLKEVEAFRDSKAYH